MIYDKFAEAKGTLLLLSVAEVVVREYTVRRSGRQHTREHAHLYYAGVAELVDAPDSKSGFFGSASSILALGTIVVSEQRIQ